MNSQINSEASLDVAVQILANSYFEERSFRCSTKIKSGASDIIEAIKTVIFDASGMAVTFFTPYRFKGLFTKKITYSKNIFDGVTRNFFRRG